MADIYRKHWIKGGHSTTASHCKGKGSSVERRLERLEELGKISIKTK